MASRHPQPPLTTTPTPTTTMSKRKDLFPINPPLNKARTTGRKTVDPFEARLHHIRIHLLSDKTIKKRIHAEPTRVLDPFLYLGGLQSLNDQARLQQLNITHILSVVFYPLKSNLIPGHVKHLFLKADDSIFFDISPHFQAACRFIDEAHQTNGRVLVHCACGVSRSSTLCCAYLIKHHGMSLEEALVHLRSRRSIVQPNSGFLRQLIHFNEQIERDRTVVDDLVDRLENV